MFSTINIERKNYGELLVRGLSEKAQKYVEGTDPCYIYCDRDETNIILKEGEFVNEFNSAEDLERWLEAGQDEIDRLEKEWAEEDDED